MSNIPKYEFRNITKEDVLSVVSSFSDGCSPEEFLLTILKGELELKTARDIILGLRDGQKPV